MKICLGALPRVLLLAAVCSGSAAQAQSGDADGDGIADAQDACAYTTPTTAVDPRGCPESGDEDTDGIADARDECPYSPPRSLVDDKGCAVDNDFDGIPDGIDRCGDTELGAKVNLEGCAQGQAPGAPSTTAAQEPAPAPAASPAAPEAESAAAAAPAEPAPAEIAPVVEAPVQPEPAAVVAEPAPLPKRRAPAPAIRTYPIGQAPRPSEAPAPPRVRPATATTVAPPSRPAEAVVSEIEVPMLRAGAAATAATVRVESPRIETDGDAPVTVIEIPLAAPVTQRRPVVEAEISVAPVAAPEPLPPAVDPAPAPSAEPAAAPAPMSAAEPALEPEPVAAPEPAAAPVAVAPAKAVAGPVYLYGRPIVVVPAGPKLQHERNKLPPAGASAPAPKAALPATRVASAGLLTFRPRRVHFATNSQDITEYSMGVLDTIAASINALIAAKPDARFGIVGYVDAGTEGGMADELSLKRAELVRAFLVSKGIDGSHLDARGAGAREALRAAGDADAARLNPRVEIHALN